MTTIRDLFSSKKYLMMLTGVVVLLGAKFGLQLDNELIAAILALIAVTIGAQGIADQGKEAAKINAAAPPKLEAIAVANQMGTLERADVLAFIEKNRETVRALLDTPPEQG